MPERARMPPPRSLLPPPPVAAPAVTVKPSTTASPFVPAALMTWKLLSVWFVKFGPSSPSRSPLRIAGAAPKGGRPAGLVSPPMKPPRIVTPFFGRKDAVRGPPGAAGRYTPSATQISSPATAAVMASWRPSAPWNASDQELPSPAPVERFASTKCVVCASAVAARLPAASSARGKVRRVGAVMVGELGGEEGDVGFSDACSALHRSAEGPALRTGESAAGQAPFVSKGGQGCLTDR